MTTGNEPMKTIEEAEIIGPTGCLDILILMPCTGNTMAKLANGITDTPGFNGSQKRSCGMKNQSLSLWRAMMP